LINLNYKILYYLLKDIRTEIAYAIRSSIKVDLLYTESKILIGCLLECDQ